MTAIHLDPLPPRCNPGAVLAFVCNHTGLDRKHVGKIALIGRGATVEIEDRHAAKAVAALDGRAFNDRPVRARFAGKADFTNADHFGTLSKLLDLEADAEEAEARRRAADGTDRGDGGTLLGLVLRESEFGLGGRLLLTLGRASRTEPLPPNRLGPGSPVVLMRTKPQRGVTFRGVVFDRAEATIGVAIEPPDYDFDDDEGWRLDLSPDEVSRLRQQDALRRAAGAEGDRLAALRAVLLGERAPEFDADQPEPAFLTVLNEPQRDAVRLALSAKDVAVIHGPPGTGKTTTVAELIRCLVTRGDRVLACAASNHAVDNLLDKLLRVGLEPVRLGHPARVVPEFRARALDVLAEKHPDARQARKVAREAFALFRSADKWTRDKPTPGSKGAMRKEARVLLAEVRRLEALAVERVLDDARVVCATLTGLDGQTLGRRTFDTAVLDEACQSTEPASWLPLLRAGRVVLAGDHCQLPPTVLSAEAADAGLSVSLMERIVGRFGGQIARRLTVQYRMHESIQAFPSAEFYDGELVADSSVASHRLSELPGVTAEPLTETPVRFIDTAGAGYDEEQEAETASRLNRREAALVAKQVRALLAAGLAAEQVAVITPYRGQVRLLRELLKAHPVLEIDSVDGFQGREKEAVVVSLVRSNPAGEIGFLADTRRTNVALTRARRALVVVGDSATLAAEPFYARMIAHFEATGAYSSVWELDADE